MAMLEEEPYLARGECVAQIAATSPRQGVLDLIALIAKSGSGGEIGWVMVDGARRYG
jgi:hypothetical protein